MLAGRPSDVRVENVPDPKILNPRDAIVKITSTGDLRLRPAPLRRLHPHHEAGRHPRPRVHGRGRRGRAGRQEPQDRRPRRRARSRSPAAAASSASSELWSLCDNSNPNAWMAEKAVRLLAGAASSATRTCCGGYAGGQAEYARVPFADVGPIKVPDGLTDEQVLFLSDIFPTGYMAAENCDIQPGDTVAVWGCGPVGQFAIQSAYLLGAERVIAIDRFPERLQHGRDAGQAPRRSTTRTSRRARRRSSELTGGRGPDACIDAVGMEAHGTGARRASYDRVKHAAVPGDRPAARAAPGDPWPAARAAPSPSPASTAASSTSSRSAPPSTRA